MFPKRDIFLAWVKTSLRIKCYTGCIFIPNYRSKIHKLNFLSTNLHFMDFGTEEKYEKTLVAYTACLIYDNFHVKYL